MSLDISLENSLKDAERLALEAIESVSDLKALDVLKSEILGKKSPIRGLMKRLGEFPAEQRPAAGQAINGAAIRVEQAYAARHAMMSDAAMQARIQSESIDVTLPGSSVLPRGSVHPLVRTMDEMVRVLVSMGYEVATGPEVESEYNNFDALNIAANHPARDMHDTFYLPGGLILRTHTSPVQVRHMLSHKPPVAIISPGRVYRVDDVDATHSPVFHQLEGLYVDKEVSLAHLKGTLQEFLRAMFGAGLSTRFRPSYFPFTEPSAEVDVQCFVCRGASKTCRVCKGTGWIEVGGAGMVHPKVLENVGYDSNEVSGFAFGLGVERFTMLKYGLSSMRPLYENDVRFLRQFA
jgi:phenylalanyl-tRNA synthetase alpha chain